MWFEVGTLGPRLVLVGTQVGTVFGVKNRQKAARNWRKTNQNGGGYQPVPTFLSLSSELKEYMRAVYSIEIAGCPFWLVLVGTLKKAALKAADRVSIAAKIGRNCNGLGYQPGLEVGTQVGTLKVRLVP